LVKQKEKSSIGLHCHARLSLNYDSPGSGVNLDPLATSSFKFPLGTISMGNYTSTTTTTISKYTSSSIICLSSDAHCSSITVQSVWL
jgi:hypothetical protein